MPKSRSRPRGERNISLEYILHVQQPSSSTRRTRSMSENTTPSFWTLFSTLTEEQVEILISGPPTSGPPIAEPPISKTPISTSVENDRLNGRRTVRELFALDECATFDISHEVDLIDDPHDPTASGGFCHVFLGRRKSVLVAMKRLDEAKNGPEALKRRFIEECKIWKKLDHPNVLEFYGMVALRNSVFMVSPFMENGTARKWLESNRPQGLRVLLEAAQGCHYLHTLTPKPIVHGDINGVNILIAKDGRAVISDFGLSKMVDTLTSQGLKGLGTVPYMAPELFIKYDDLGEKLDNTGVPVTKTLKTDIFAFGRTVLELLSGQLPFGSHGLEPQMWEFARQGKCPSPKTLAAKRWITGEIWDFINEMTQLKPELRPTIGAVKVKLQGFQVGTSGAGIL